MSMVLPCYLAMTEEEFTNAPHLPPKIGWMACQFAPYGSGLSGLPEHLPPGSLIFLNDRIPPRNSDPDKIVRQLKDLCTREKAAGLAVDFQQPMNPEKEAIVKALSRDFPVSVAFSEICRCPGPVLLSPPPVRTALSSWLAPWKEREIWLDFSPGREYWEITKAGARLLPDRPAPENAEFLQDSSLFCHYFPDVRPDAACFWIYRTEEDLRSLLREASRLGVKKAVGLYRELSSCF